MNDKTGPNIGDLELVVLGILWRSDRPVSGKELHRQISMRSKTSPNVVYQMLPRMVVKGLIRRYNDEDPYTYEVLVSRQDLIDRFTQRIMGA